MFVEPLFQTKEVEAVADQTEDETQTSPIKQASPVKLVIESPAKESVSIESPMSSISLPRLPKADKLILTQPLHDPPSTKTKTPVILSYGSGNSTLRTLSKNYMLSHNARVPQYQQLANILSRNTKMLSYDARRKQRDVQRKAGDLLASTEADPYVKNDSGLRQFIRAQEVVDGMCGRFMTEYNAQYVDWNKKERVELPAVDETKINDVKKSKVRKEKKVKESSENENVETLGLRASASREPLVQIQKQTLDSAHTAEHDANKFNAETDHIKTQLQPEPTKEAPSKPIPTAYTSASTHNQPTTSVQSSTQTPTKQRSELDRSTSPIEVRPRVIMKKPIQFLEALIPASNINQTAPFISHEKRHYPPTIDHLQIQIEEMYLALVNGESFENNENEKENGRGVGGLRGKIHKPPRNVLGFAKSVDAPVSSYTIANEPMAKLMKSKKKF